MLCRASGTRLPWLATVGIVSALRPVALRASLPDRRDSSVPVRLLVLVLLEHVLHGVLHEEDVRSVGPVHLEGRSVIPLDGAADLFAVPEDDDHPRLVVH